MKRQVVYFLTGMVITVLFVAFALGSDGILRPLAQISTLPTSTYTPVPSGPTPTSTSIPHTPTNTPVPPTPTQTPAPYSCDIVLDDFNRRDGGVGRNWRGFKKTDHYKILDEEVYVRFGGPLYWGPTTFGADQEACITLTQIGRRAHHSVMLKVQRWRYWKGNIKVFYNSEMGAVGVDTTVPEVGKTLLATWPMTLSAGDQLGGRALVDGTVEVYVNGVLIGSAEAGPFFVDKGGAIGLWFWSPLKPHAIMDDFGGGDIP